MSAIIEMNTAELERRITQAIQDGYRMGYSTGYQDCKEGKQYRPPFAK